MKKKGFRERVKRKTKTGVCGCNVMIVKGSYFEPLKHMVGFDVVLADGLRAGGGGGRGWEGGEANKTNLN